MASVTRTPSRRRPSRRARARRLRAPAGARAHGGRFTGERDPGTARCHPRSVRRPGRSGRRAADIGADLARHRGRGDDRAHADGRRLTRLDQIAALYDLVREGEGRALSRRRDRAHGRDPRMPGLVRLAGGRVRLHRRRRRDHWCWSRPRRTSAWRPRSVRSWPSSSSSLRPGLAPGRSYLRPRHSWSRRPSSQRSTASSTRRPAADRVARHAAARRRADDRHGEARLRRDVAGASRLVYGGLQLSLLAFGIVAERRSRAAG